MCRPFRVIVSMGALAAVAALAGGCGFGTQRIKVPTSQPQLHRGAVLFSQRCAGCHTLSYAATHGSATNIRTALITNGPNLDQRCERPADRVLYAIVNGGFSGAIMPQNVVVGQDARDVAMFVSRYAGTQASTSPGVTKCQAEPIGTLPPPPALATAASATPSATPRAAAKTVAGATAAHRARARARAAKARATAKKK